MVLAMDSDISVPTGPLGLLRPSLPVKMWKVESTGSGLGGRGLRAGWSINLSRNLTGSKHL